MILDLVNITTLIEYCNNQYHMLIKIYTFHEH